MRVLAVDPGSRAAALVFFVDGRPKYATLLEQKRQKDDWHTRMGLMASDLHEVLEEVFDVDVIAIEKVVAHRNLKVAITMAKTVGYLTRTLEVLFPTATWLEVPKADVCHAIGIKGNATRAERQDAARAWFPSFKQQDVCDAAAVGAAAYAMLARKGGSV